MALAEGKTLQVMYARVTLFCCSNEHINRALHNLRAQVRALVLVLQAHMERKDIVRAAMRSAANLIRVRSVVRP